IRFIGRFLKYSLICVFVLLVTFIIAIQIPAFQTYLGKKASAWLSEQLNTTISIGKVDVDFFNSVVLKDVYAEDLKNDTLLYGAELSCKITDFSYSEHKLILKEIELSNINANLIKYKGDKVYNYQFIADYFAPIDTIKDTVPSDFIINYGILKLNNINFSF